MALGGHQKLPHTLSIPLLIIFARLALLVGWLETPQDFIPMSTEKRVFCNSSPDVFGHL